MCCTSNALVDMKKHPKTSCFGLFAEHDWTNWGEGLQLIAGGLGSVDIWVAVRY